MPGVIIVLAYLTFIDPFEADSIADFEIIIVIYLEHIVPVSRIELPSTPLDFLLNQWCLLVLS